jgi:hypothetical protein
VTSSIVARNESTVPDFFDAGDIFIETGVTECEFEVSRFKLYANGGIGIRTDNSLMERRGARTPGF